MNHIDLEDDEIYEDNTDYSVFEGLDDDLANLTLNADELSLSEIYELADRYESVFHQHEMYIKESNVQEIKDSAEELGLHEGCHIICPIYFKSGEKAPWVLAKFTLVRTSEEGYSADSSVSFPWDDEDDDLDWE